MKHLLSDPARDSYNILSGNEFTTEVAAKMKSRCV